MFFRSPLPSPGLLKTVTHVLAISVTNVLAIFCHICLGLGPFCLSEHPRGRSEESNPRRLEILLAGGSREQPTALNSPAAIPVLKVPLVVAKSGNVRGSRLLTTVFGLAYPMGAELLAFELTRAKAAPLPGAGALPWA